MLPVLIGYEGVACQRTVCPEDCNGRGTCWPERILATYAGTTITINTTTSTTTTTPIPSPSLIHHSGREYRYPWDAMKQVGCYCDPGFRGGACELQECPSGADPLDGWVDIDSVVVVVLVVDSDSPNCLFLLAVIAMATKPGEIALVAGFATTAAELATASKASTERDASTTPRCSNN